MPATLPPLGVDQVSFGKPDPTASVPSLAAATVSVSVVTPDVFSKNSSLLPLNGSYKITTALMGFDMTNRGYTLGISSAQSATVSPTLGDGILIRIDSPYPAGMENAIAAAIWVQQGSADPQLTSFGFIDPFTDFSYLLMSRPLRSALMADQAVLGAATATTDLGDRDAKQVIYTDFIPTTRGVRRNHRFTKVPYAPDDSVDSDVITAHGTDMAFSCYTDSLELLAQAIAGDYVQFTDTDSSIVTQLESNLYATTSNVEGNRPLRVLSPPNNLGEEVTTLYVGNVAVNSDDFTEQRLKTEAGTVDFLLKAANFDRLLTPMRTGIRWSRRA